MDYMDMMASLGISVPITILLTVIAYVVFTGTEAGRNSTLGDFLNFERLYIDSFFKLLYIFCVMAVTVISVGLIFQITKNPILGLVPALAFFMIAQFVIRLLFEFSMAFVRMAVDVHDLRNAYFGVFDSEEASSSCKKDIDFHAAASSAASLASAAASKVSRLASEGAEHARGYAEAHGAPHKSVPSAPISEYKGDSSHSASVLKADAGVQDGWDCPCGAGGNQGKFCGFCGAPRS